jgi:hypothetical protein
MWQATFLQLWTIYIQALLCSLSSTLVPYVFFCF